MRTVVVFLLLLIPSALYVWRNPDLPEFGRNDDGLLFVSAKSLASGEGFRIISLPEQPAQTKYPVLYPLYLSLIWKLNPQYPENLRVARLFSWVLLVVCLALCWAYYRREGFSAGRTILLVALLGLNPYMILFGSNLYSEMFFMCWLFIVLLLAHSTKGRMILLAGVAAGCAYLSRTAGAALLVAIPAWYLWRRESRRAISFVGGMLPFVIGWTLWSRTHAIHSDDLMLIYHTDYLKMELLTVNTNTLPLIVWKNIDALLVGLGGLAIPQVVALLPAKLLTQTVAVAMISGTVRMFKRGIAVPYIFFAIVSSLMLVVWHFPPNERFVLPLCPLALAGLLIEIEHIGTMLKAGFRHKDASQRMVARGMAGTFATILAGTVALQCYVSFVRLNDAAGQDRDRLSHDRAAYEWIHANVPDSANVLSNDDAILYLYSGRRGHVLPLLPIIWYTEDHASTVASYRDVASYCRSHNLQYFYSSGSDTDRWTYDPADAEAVSRAIHDNPELLPQFASGTGTVFKIR